MALYFPLSKRMHDIIFNPLILNAFLTVYLNSLLASLNARPSLQKIADRTIEEIYLDGRVVRLGEVPSQIVFLQTTRNSDDGSNVHAARSGANVETENTALSEA